MSELTIGVFDSGMGGLTAMEALTEQLPGARLIYFGDTGHMPYGGRSSAQLHYMARRNIAFLEDQGAQLILAACGTVTSVALDDVAEETATPLFGVAKPAVERAAKLTKNKKIGFLATEACVASGFNQALLETHIPGVEVYARACPKLVPLIEAGVCRGDDPVLRAALADYLSEIRDAACDTVILGCPHYPIIAKADRGPEGQRIRSS
jgi:glutamate racemase